MSEIINRDDKEEIKQLAHESMQYLEPICQDCWERGEDDVLGLMSGVQTRYSKRLTQLAEAIVDDHPEAEMMWIDETREELVELFYKERDELFYQSDMRVDNELKCFYCFERKKSDRNSDELPIRLANTEGKSEHLFSRTENEWR